MLPLHRISWYATARWIEEQKEVRLHLWIASVQHKRPMDFSLPRDLANEVACDSICNDIDEGNGSVANSASLAFQCFFHGIRGNDEAFEKFWKLGIRRVCRNSSAWHATFLLQPNNRCGHALLHWLVPDCNPYTQHHSQLRVTLCPVDPEPEAEVHEKVALTPLEKGTKRWRTKTIISRQSYRKRRD